MKFALYSVLRLAFFLVPFGVLMLMPIFQDLWWLAGIFAALIGLSLSIIFLRGPLTRVSAEMYERQQRRTTKTVREEDADAEDAALDGDERESR